MPAITKPKPAMIHLLVPNSDGPIKSAGLNSDQPCSFHVACEPGHPLPMHATGETGAVTCPNCKKTAEFKDIQLKEQIGSDLDARALRALEEEKIREAGKCAGC